MHPISPHTELSIRLGFFFSILVLMFVWQWLLPRRRLAVPKMTRRLCNLSIVFIDSFIVRILFPAAAVGVAIFAQQNQIGFFNHFQMNKWFVVIASILILDLTIYFQHVMFHVVPLFWRFHRMHHIDLDFDVTTGVRFHPFEIVISMFIKSAAIILMGCSSLGVIIFEILLNGTSMFNHGNVFIPLKIDKLIRKIIVTPDMHRVHHSVIPRETNSNFGFNLSIWDRIFKTYRAEPEYGHDHMTIGIKTIRELKYCQNVLGMLWVPFLRK